MTLRHACLLFSRLHSVDKAALYEETGSDRSVHRSPWGSVTVSREAFELLRLKDRAMDNVKEGITIADCRQEMPYTRVNLRHHKDYACNIHVYFGPSRCNFKKIAQCCTQCSLKLDYLSNK